MPQILVTPEDLRNIAGQLSNKQGQATQLLTEMISTVNNLQGQWKGTAHTRYAQAFESQVPPMKTKLDEILTELVEKLKQAADVLERADETAVA